MPPTALMDSLQQVRQRVRRLSILFGLGLVICASAGLLLAVLVLDYLLDLPPIPRIVVMTAAAATAAYVFIRWVGRPARAKLTLSEVAARLEDAFPHFDDRLRSSVDFATRTSPGSRIMQDRVMNQAAELAQRVDLKSAILTKPVWQSLAGAAGSILALVILGLLLGGEYLLPAMSRLLTPFDGRPWPKRVQIVMDAQLPHRVPAGRQVEVRIRLLKGDKPSRQATVCLDWGDGRIEKDLMTRDADGVYTASLDARGEGVMRVWTECGDDATTPQNIVVVPQLAIKSVQLTVTPPPYTGEPATTVPLDSGAATVTYGSTLSLLATFNKNIDSAHSPEILPGQTQPKIPTVAWRASTGSSAQGTWLARDSVAFGLRAHDADGFANVDASEYQVIVRPDQPPDVQITRPEHNEECTPQAVVPLRAIAEDDFGISSLRLVVMRIGDHPETLAAVDLIRGGVLANGAVWTPIETMGELRRWQLDYPWDLSKIQPALRNGDLIEYHLEVTDNFSFEGQTHPPVSSSSFRISIVSQEQFTSLMGDLLAQVRQQVVDIRNGQRAMKDETADLQHQTAKQAQFSVADRAQGVALVAAQTTAASQTKQASGQLDDLVARMDENKSTAQDLRTVAAAVRDDLNDVAEHPMKTAAAQIDDAKDMTGDADARNAELDAAQQQQEEAARKLDEAASHLGEAGGLPKEIEQLQEILAEQNRINRLSDEIGLRNLGKLPGQMPDSDRTAQQKNADDQSSLADKLQKEIDQLAALARRMEKSDPASSEALQQAAKSGQSQDVASQMRSSSDAQRQNQQAAAQQAQAQAEIGLQMMIRQLEEAQRRKLEELAEQLADLQQQLQSLIRQQAALNYQNLALRSDDTLAKMDPKLIDDLLSDAQWVRGHEPPVPDLDTQSRLQEQNERNARSVGKQSESLPDGAAIAVGLDRAAERMGRAIGILRDDSQTDSARLSGAYDPPQIEALAALEQVRDILDEQSRKNSDALNQQKKDSLRVAYEKILVSQKKIDADTKHIDQSPRTADGEMGHREAIRLGQLPLEQGDLADRTAKMQDDLSALGGIVYVWANNDIAQAMREVQADLAKPETDAATQAEQQRIEDQLSAMIDSLKVKPKQSQFAQPHSGGRGGGNGGQGGAMPLPPEAELRLLKQLQMAVNRSTQVISQQPAPDQPKLVALGQRQGELRTLLDQLLQKSSHGQASLGPEPDPNQKLPEEASDEDIDNQELEHVLLNGDGQPDPDQVKNDVSLVGQRMSRSKQRLASDHDPGETTQKIQNRILDNLDALIEMARAEQSEPPPGGKGQPSQASDPTAGVQPDNSASGHPSTNLPVGSTPAVSATNNRDVDTTGTPTTNITQTLKEWGALSPRKRAAVIEAATEKPIEKFRGLIDDYYRALGTRAGQ